MGRRLAPALAKSHQVLGTYLKEPAPVAGCELAPLDVADEAAVMRRFAQFEPELVVHAAAMASPERCQQEPQEARRVNVEGTRAVARACRTAGALLFYVSTDLVFDGKSPPYREDQPPNPLNLYARTKREGELAARELCPDALVLRLALCYGFKRVGAPTFTDWLYATLSQGRKAQLFTDQFRAALYLGDAARMVARLAELAGRGKAAPGVFHLAGPERVSRFRFGELLCQAFGFRSSLLVPALMAEVPSAAPRPADCTLDGSKLNSLLGYRPMTVAEGLRAMRGEPRA